MCVYYFNKTKFTEKFTDHQPQTTLNFLDNAVSYKSIKNTYG